MAFRWRPPNWNRTSPQSVEDAKKQYQFDRLPKDPTTKLDEPLLKFKRGALVHFAVSTDEV